MEISLTLYFCNGHLSGTPFDSFVFSPYSYFVTNKERKNPPPKVRPFSHHPSGTAGRLVQDHVLFIITFQCVIPEHIPMIKKYSELFKQNFDFQSKISSDYERGTQNFQFRYNQAHPNARIWRHMLYKRTFFFFRDGIAFSVQVTLVRFVYAGTSRTFTFYGDLFCAFSHFSSEFIRQAVAEKDLGDSFPALTVPEVVLNVWGSLPPSGFRPRTNPPDITA